MVADNIGRPWEQEPIVWAVEFDEGQWYGDRDAWSDKQINYGWGSTNMPVGRWGGLVVMASALSDHPMAHTWMKDAGRYFDMLLRTEFARFYMQLMKPIDPRWGIRTLLNEGDTRPGSSLMPGILATLFRNTDPQLAGELVQLWVDGGRCASAATRAARLIRPASRSPSQQTPPPTGVTTPARYRSRVHRRSRPRLRSRPHSRPRSHSHRRG